MSVTSFIMYLFDDRWMDLHWPDDRIYSHLILNLQIIPTKIIISNNQTEKSCSLVKVHPKNDLHRKYEYQVNGSLIFDNTSGLWVDCSFPLNIHNLMANEKHSDFFKSLGFYPLTRENISDFYNSLIDKYVFVRGNILGAWVQAVEWTQWTEDHMTPLSSIVRILRQDHTPDGHYFEF